MKNGGEQLQMTLPTKTGQKLSVLMQRALNNVPVKRSEIAQRSTLLVLYRENIQTQRMVMGTALIDSTMTAKFTYITESRSNAYATGIAIGWRVAKVIVPQSWPSVTTVRISHLYGSTRYSRLLEAVEVADPSFSSGGESSMHL